MLNEKVLFKVSPMKCVMIFEKKGKLISSFIGPFKILEKVGDMVYTWDRPPKPIKNSSSMQYLDLDVIAAL